MASEKGKKVHVMHDHQEIAQVILRGVEVGIDAGGRTRCRVDDSLTDEELAAIVEALPEFTEKLRKRLPAARRILH